MTRASGENQIDRPYDIAIAVDKCGEVQRRNILLGTREPPHESLRTSIRRRQQDTLDDHPRLLRFDVSCERHDVFGTVKQPHLCAQGDEMWQRRRSMADCVR